MLSDTPHTVQVNPFRSRVLLAAVAVVVSVASLTACSGGKDSVSQTSSAAYRFNGATKNATVIPEAKRKVVGPVQGTLLAGGDYTLKSDLGKVVVMNFFASWCGPCQNETPQFDSVYRQRKADGVNFVGFDVKDPSKSASSAWLKSKQISFPVVYDESAKTAIQLGNVPLAALPATVVIDKQGRVAGVYVGTLLPADLTPVLDDLTKEA